MLAIGNNVKIFCHKDAVDMRKGFEGLRTIVENFLAQSVTKGGYFVFLNRSRDRMKVLYWDTDGLAIWYKRLEQGSFPKPDKNGVEIDRREFFMLLEGVVPMKMQKRFKI